MDIVKVFGTNLRNWNYSGRAMFYSALRERELA